MFGGSIANSADLVPSDIEIIGNHFFKPLSWCTSDPSYAGIHWSVKNIFELKDAHRVLVEGNIFENNWVDGQDGKSILLTGRGENPSASLYQGVWDITFNNNILFSAQPAGGYNILGTDDGFPATHTGKILIQNTLMYNIRNLAYQILSGASDITINHNTTFNSDTLIMFDGAPSPNFTYINNLTARIGGYGIFGSGKGEGNVALNYYTPNFRVSNNVFAKANASSYPAGNFFPTDLSSVIIDQAGGDYHVIPTSQYATAATDGTACGADIDSVYAATADTVG
jgi:hypothetical protein